MTMASREKTIVTACAAVAFALSVTACGSSTTSEVASSASSVASSASSAMSSAGSAASSIASSAVAQPAAADGTLATVCGEIDSVMMGEPDADPAGTAATLEAIATKISTPDAELVENLADAYTDIAASPDDPAVQEELKSSASALGAGCELATTTATPN